MAFNIRIPGTGALFEDVLQDNGPEKQKQYTPGPINSNNFAEIIGKLSGDVGTDINFITASQRGFERNAIIYRCIQEVAGGVAGLRWVLKNKRTEKEIDNHPLLDLIENPNPLQGQSTFFHNVQADKMLDGNYFIQLVKREPLVNSSSIPSNTPPLQIWALRPDMVTVEINTSRLPIAYQYLAGNMGGQSMTFPVNQITGQSNIIHGTSYAPLRETQRGRGLSPVRAAWLSTQQHNEGVLWNRNLLKNGAMPPLFLESANTFTQQQIDDLRKALLEYQGPANAGKPMFTGGGITAKQLAFNPEQMQYNKSQEAAARNIALTLGVPPILLSLPGDAAYNNYESARKALYQETILPEAYALRDEFNRSLVPLYGNNLYLDIDLDCIEALAPDRQQKWTTISNSAFLTINEKRAALGYEPVDNGDSILIPTNVMPLEETVETGEQEGDDTVSGDNATQD